MALFLSKSRKLICLKPKIGFLSSVYHLQTLISPNLRTPFRILGLNHPHFASFRFESTKAQTQLNPMHCIDNDSKVLNFPGGEVKFTSHLNFIPEKREERVHCYRVLDDDGYPITSNFAQIEREVALKIYTDMITLQTMDTIFYEAQRQGRISFYVTTLGEEAINIASAAALKTDDFIFPQFHRVSREVIFKSFPQITPAASLPIFYALAELDTLYSPFSYRESGVLLWRGFTIQEFANQLFGNKNDYGKGRQMPVHYGSNKHNYITVASTVATQLPHAVGAAYALKMDAKNACTIVYFGDGGSSTGDFHAALNFAAVLDAPVIFFCRNNGFAISTPVSEQFRSDGVITKGQGYGIRSIRVDGNDALAVFTAVQEARKMAINEHRPVLVEALTYRAGHHSTSDDSIKYRPANEIEWWRTARDPVSRFRKWIEREGWLNSQTESELRSNIRKQVLQAIQVAEKQEKPPIKDVFTDVYDVSPANLQEQEISIRETIRRHPQDYPTDVPF